MLCLPVPEVMKHMANNVQCGYTGLSNCKAEDDMTDVILSDH